MRGAHQEVSALEQLPRVRNVDSQKVSVDPAQPRIELLERRSQPAHVLRCPRRDHVEIDRRAYVAVGLDGDTSDKHIVDLVLRQRAQHLPDVKRRLVSHDRAPSTPCL